MQSVTNDLFAYPGCSRYSRRVKTSGSHSRRGKAADILPALVLAACVALLSGCASTSDASSSTTPAIDIKGNTPGQISAVTRDIFVQNGYQPGFQPGKLTLTSLVFEKKASGMRNIISGDWSDIPLWVRVKLSIRHVDEQTYRLECQSCLVRDRGSPLEEEIKSGSLNPKPYQELLDQVAKRLGGSGS